MAVSCAVVRLCGALLPLASVDQLTASLASATNRTPPLPLTGSVAARPREERPKSSQNPPFGSLMLAASVAMPADEPFGRAILAQPLLVLIRSPSAPVFGLTASQL